MNTADTWVFFTPNPQQRYKIYVYDDGNQVYAPYKNEWLITGQWRGKYALVNSQEPTISINSISQWKIVRI